MTETVDLTPIQFTTAEFLRMAEAGILDRLCFTTEEFEALAEIGILEEGGNYELIDGRIYPMAPELYDQASRARRIAELFQHRIGQIGLRWGDYVQEGHPIEIPRFNEPEPDVALLYGEPGRTPRPVDVRLLVEISHTTYRKDRGVKWRMYAAAGIPEYWIVRMEDDEPRVLEVYRRPEGTGDQAVYHEQATYGYDDQVEVMTWPELGLFEVEDVLG